MQHLLCTEADPLLHGFIKSVLMLDSQAVKPLRLHRNGPNGERSLRPIVWLRVEGEECFITLLALHLLSQQPWSMDAGFSAPPVIQWVTLGGVTIVLAQQTCEFPCKLLLAHQTKSGTALVFPALPHT
ncbi:protein sidekick-1 [Platysternon megacephalum]|uniref:Protein sidekick-1 n=1 Tax=Platysternon megacephalum TaxID=55544 RepID=A0A4D9EKC5_9SAUR|nr:protein sidekick-1 [Platysternon megacephalum]